MIGSNDRIQRIFISLLSMGKLLQTYVMNQVMRINFLQQMLPEIFKIITIVTILGKHLKGKE